MTPRRLQILAGATLLSALLAIAAAPWAIDQPWLAVIFKPLTTLLIIGHAGSRDDTPHGLRRWILAGLWLSLVGDVALLWPQQGFMPGLLAFLLAHLCYLVAFTRDSRLLQDAPLAFVGYGGVAGVLLAMLWPDIPGPLRLPVVAYVVCLAGMAAQAAARASRWRVSPQARLAQHAAVGGALFVCSDALLAINRFSLPLPAASLLVLGTYWAAQWFIASTLPPRSPA